MFKSFFAKPPALSPEQLAEYRSICESATELLEAAGVKLKPYHEDRPLELESNPRPLELIANLRAYRDALAACAESGESPADDRVFVWRALSRLGLTPPSDLMTHVTGQDTIQIFSPENQIMFVNLEFFKYMDATLDEVFSTVWDRDSKRDMKVTLELLRLIFLMKTRQLRKTFSITGIGRHTVEFTKSGIWQKVAISLKVACPLFRDGAYAGVMATQKTERLDSRRVAPEKN